MSKNEEIATRYLNTENNPSKEAGIFRGIVAHAGKAAVIGAFVGLALGATAMPFVGLSSTAVLGFGAALGAGVAFAVEAVTEYALLKGVRIGHRIGVAEIDAPSAGRDPEAQSRTLPPGSVRIDQTTDYRSMIRNQRANLEIDGSGVSRR